jgi:hypothetical protein
LKAHRLICCRNGNSPSATTTKRSRILHRSARRRAV